MLFQIWWRNWFSNSWILQSLDKWMDKYYSHGDQKKLVSEAKQQVVLMNFWLTFLCSILSLGTCSFDGLLYAAGGYDGASCLSSVEYYDPLTGIWSSCPAMSTRRRYCRVAVLENCIYTLGGFDSSNYQASVERFDPRAGLWSSVPCMSSRRSSCGVATLDGFLYCIGGSDGTMCMSSGERFNIRTNSWEPVAPMHSR